MTQHAKMLGRDPQMPRDFGIRQQTLVAKVERCFELRVGVQPGRNFNRRWTPTRIGER